MRGDWPTSNGFDPSACTNISKERFLNLCG
jgi:hypothetical protein